MKELVLSTAPFVKAERDTPAIMREVFLASCVVLVEELLNTITP